MCVFCNIINNIWSSKKVYEDDDVLAILDLSQQGYGHTLVMPKKHIENMLEMDKDTLAKVMEVVRKLTILYKEKLHADGFNIVNNCNEVAGQSVMHFHMHIIPRYKDDNNKLLFLNNYDKENIKDANNEGLFDLDEILRKIKE